MRGTEKEQVQTGHGESARARMGLVMGAALAVLSICSLGVLQSPLPGATEKRQGGRELDKRRKAKERAVKQTNRHLTDGRRDIILCT